MPIPHDTLENPSSQEPYFEPKTGPFTDAVGTHPLSTNAAASNPEPQNDGDDEAANSAPPDTLGGLVDPDLATMEDGT